MDMRQPVGHWFELPGRFVAVALVNRYNPLEPTYQRAADEGLSKFLAFLKKEEAREDAEARERLRPIGTQVHLQSTCHSLLAL